MSELNGVGITIKRLGTNQYQLTDDQGQSINITTIGILEIAAYADTEEVVEADARQDVRDRKIIN